MPDFDAIGVQAVSRLQHLIGCAELRGNLGKIIAGFHRVDLFATWGGAFKRRHSGSPSASTVAAGEGMWIFCPICSLVGWMPGFALGDGFEGDMELLRNTVEDVPFYDGVFRSAGRHGRLRQVSRPTGEATTTGELLVATGGLVVSTNAGG